MMKLFITNLFNKYMQNFVKKFVKKENNRLLGRWNIDYCDKKMNNKIDLSNEDHCGPCGQYILNKTKTKLYNNNNNNNNTNIGK